MSYGVDAYALFLRTRSALTSVQYPSRIDYTIAVRGTEGAAVRINHYRATCNPTDQSIRIFPISDEELASPPPVPHGINVFIQGNYESFGRVAPPPDIIGVPVLSPTYTFGLGFNRAVNGSLRDSTSTIPTIVVVSSRVRDYSVVLLDEPNLDGVATYHLKLTPLHSPKQNRLRELWIDAADYLPQRAVLAGNFTIAPLVDVPWVVNFAHFEGALYISRESTAATLHFSHRRAVQNASITFEDIREHSGLEYDMPLVEPEDDNNRLVEPSSAI